MSWLLFAIGGHLANGIAFAIDKILLKSAFTRSATYAGIVGLLSAGALVLIPWVDSWPSGLSFEIGIISGATFILALWAFFGALSRAEASRVVPIVGSLIPILTLLGTYFFLGERLSQNALIGFGLLIIATALLSGGAKGKSNRNALLLSLLSAVLFAIASITAKYVYDHSGFLGSFLLTRIVAACMSLLLICVLDPRAGKEVLSVIRPANKTQKKSKRSAALLALVGQTLGAAGFVCIQWSTAQGSASIVNALQAVQYAFLVILAVVLHKRAPQLLGEELTARVLTIKTIALILTAIGLALIV